MRGKGTQAEPYVIETDSDFYVYLYRGSFYKKTYFKLGCNVDLTNLTDTGISSFSNVYLDGDGYELTVKLTEEQICKVSGTVTYYSCSLFDTFASSELHNLKINLTIDVDIEAIGNLKDSGRLGNYCGLICFGEKSVGTGESNVIANCDITINYKQKLYRENNMVWFETCFYGLGYQPNYLTVENLTLRINALTTDYYSVFSPIPVMQDMYVKGTNSIHYDLYAEDTSAVTILYGGWFNNNYINTNSDLTVLDLSHGVEFDYYNITIDNRNFSYKGNFKTLDIYIDNTDNMNSVFSLNVKADRVRNLSFKRDNFVSFINDTNNIDIFTPVVENLELEATKRLDGYIDIHGGVYKNIYYKGGLTDGDEATLIYLNEGSVTYEDTVIVNDYDKKYSPAYTKEIWEEHYKDLYFMKGDYTDLKHLCIYNKSKSRVLNIPFYEDGELRVVVNGKLKYLRLVDESSEKASPIRVYNKSANKIYRISY